MDVEAVLAQAPDRQVATGASKLAAPAKWPELGRDDAALWGLCQGSGKSPYQVCVDLTDRATKCSCPSRKFPCKHAVALQLLHVNGSTREGNQPEWVGNWLRARHTRATTERKPAQPGKRREESVRAGIAGLTDWLTDLSAGGLHTLPSREPAWWQGIMARMVDAQAPGIASAIGELRSVVGANRPRWYEEATDHIGRLYLLTRTDDWVVLLRTDSDDGKVRTVRQWAWGRSRKQWVYTARHAAGGAIPVPAMTPGAELTAVMHPYPGGLPRRVAVGEITRTGPAGPIPVADSWEQALAAAEPLLASDPWLRLVPLCAKATKPSRDDRSLYLVDVVDRALPVRAGASLAQALARTGGAPFDAMGLWDGNSLQLCAIAEPGAFPEVVS
jgi:SWIM zinc finger